MGIGEREIEGLVGQIEALERLLMSDARTERRVRGFIRKVLKEASGRLSLSAAAAMKSDPRGASKAVRSAVYKRVLGGNLNILSGRGASSVKEWKPAVRGRGGQVGGNRRGRSGRTRQIDSYVGESRSFILRWVNSGTAERAIEFKRDGRRERVERGSRGGRVYGRTVNTGRRGSIAGRNWFGSASKREIEGAAERLVGLIDDFIMYNV